MPLLKIYNNTVHIQELNRGAPETIVLIHGMFSNLSVYYFKIAPLLAEHFHVIMYDLKSHGLSSRVQKGYRFDDMTTDLLALLDLFRLESAHLVGYSFGGLVALNTGANHPERIKSLCLIEAPNPDDRKTREVINLYSKEFLENYIQNFTDTTKVKMGKRQLEKNHKMYQYLFNDTSIKVDMERETNFFSRISFVNFTLNTLLIYGKESGCLPAGFLLSKLVKGSTLLTLKGDHNLPIQEPELLATALTKFFQHQGLPI